jgi:outer membrane protein
MSGAFRAEVRENIMPKFVGLFWVIVSILFLAPSSAPAADPATLDLQSAIIRGLSANEGIQAVRRALTATNLGTKSARGAFGPSINLNYGYTHYDEPTKIMGVQTTPQDQWLLNLNIHQPLFVGFSILSNYQKSLLAEDQAKSQLNQAELALILEIQSNFLNLLKARKNVQSAKDSLARLQSHLKVIQAFYDVGLRPKLDVLQAEVDVARAEQNLLAQQNDVDTQEARLNTLLNYPVDANITYVGELEYTPFSAQLDYCLNQAQKFRPDLIIAEQSVEIARKDTKIAGSDLYPSVAADLDYFRQGDDPTVSGNKYQDSSSWQVGLNLNWKAFEWGKTYYSYKQAEENAYRLVNEYNKLKSDASFDVKSSYLNIQEAAKRILVARTEVEAARESYRMAEARYQAQVGTNTDVLDAQSNVTMSEANLTQALADYKLAVADLYNSMGLRNLSLETH